MCVCLCFLRSFFWRVIHNYISILVCFFLLLFSMIWNDTATYFVKYLIKFWYRIFFWALLVSSLLNTAWSYNVRVSSSAIIHIVYRIKYILKRTDYDSFQAIINGNDYRHIKSVCTIYTIWCFLFCFVSSSLRLFRRPLLLFFSTFWSFDGLYTYWCCGSLSFRECSTLDNGNYWKIFWRLSSQFSSLLKVRAM